MYIELPTIEKGVTVSVDPSRIICMKFVDHRSVKSDLIINPNDDDPITIVNCEHGVNFATHLSPKQIHDLIATKTNEK